VIEIQRRPRVAFQGELGAFSEDAAIELLGPDITLVPRPTFNALFSSLDENVSDFVLAPVENTTIGEIKPVHALLAKSSLVEAGEISIRISHQLIGCLGTKLEELTAVESHPAALSQCQKFLTDHPRLEPIEADDTAGSVARIIKAAARHRAAIASERAAKLYGGAIIEKNIEDSNDNYTRFVLFRKES
jgi:prephenate dehydratase